VEASLFLDLLPLFIDFEVFCGSLVCLGFFCLGRQASVLLSVSVFSSTVSGGRIAIQCLSQSFDWKG